MKKSLEEIAYLLGGTVDGDPETVVERICAIDEAGPGDLTFLTNTKYRRKLETTRADAILVSPDTVCHGQNLVRVPDPYGALGTLLPLFHPEKKEAPGIQPGALIETGAEVSPEAVVYPGVHICRGARIDQGAMLYPGVFIGREAVVGADSVLYPRVTLYRRSIVGKRVILHAGVVVGSDGFGFAQPGLENVKIPQIGYVQIDDDVEVGANTTIDRGTLGRTWIQEGAKIDNLVQIAHNVVIGARSIVVSQVGISGSTQLGRGVIIGGQAGLVGHIKVGDRAMVAAGSGVHKDIPPGQIVAGAPHLLHREWLKIEACLPKLPELRKTLAALSRRLKELEMKIAPKDPLL
ncbi:MAG: UDP-3-O-(3-hydroxymyristoyl)glucosamine N-acyltransferase [Syntrophaceae bacterium]|nr:UDP-3-O-(3-hydroxymyristoyl)glucosamine N-acyltransferase [Syntrophaceae bacterium]